MAALTHELKPAVRQLGLRRCGGHRWTNTHGNVQAATLGMGPAASGQAMGQLLAEIDPGRVILLGLAGGLDEQLKLGDVVDVRQAIDASSGKRYSAACDGGAVAVSTDHLVATPGEKAALRRQWAADVVDMETAAVAAVCEAHGVRWQAVRAVSDPAGAELPAAVVELIETADTRALRVLGFIARHPHRVPTLMRLGRISARCGQKLADAVAAMVRPA